jgi:hypothetical protein
MLFLTYKLQVDLYFIFVTLRDMPPVDVIAPATSEGFFGKVGASGPDKSEVVVKFNILTNG